MEKLFFLLDLTLKDEKISSRIYNGKTAAPSERPFQVILTAKGLGVKRGCGGSLIKRDWVLTSAHCFMKDDDCATETILPDVVVEAGRASITQPKKGSGIQGLKISPIEVNKNVYFPLFERWIDECRQKKVDGYGNTIIAEIK